MKNTYDSNTLMTLQICSYELGATLGFCLKSDYSHPQLEEIISQSQWQMIDQGIIRRREDGTHSKIKHEIMEFEAPIWAIDTVTEILLESDKGLFPEEQIQEVCKIWSSAVAQREAFLQGSSRLSM